MSEPEPTGLPPVSSQRGTQPMALPPLSLPPSKIDPLSSLSTHHSYPSPIISSQMMASPLMSMSPSASSQVHSPLNQHILSPQSKSSFGQNTACSTSVQNQQQSQLQDFRRQNLIPGQSPDNYRAQFSHTVTTLPSNKRNVTGVHDIIGRQIQSVPSSPTMSSNSTPPQSVQMVRHGSLDALPSPGSSSSMGNPSPSSYSNHSSPMMAGQSQNMPNGHGSHSSFSTQQASSTPSQPHVVQRVAYSNQEHSVGGAIQIPQKQIAQQESTQGRISGHAGGTHMSVSINQAARNHQPILTTGQPYGTQPHQSVVAPNPSPLQQQLSSRSSQSESNSQANVLIQHQPLPPQNGTSQGQGAPLQQQQAISGRQLLHQQEIPSGPSRAIPPREVMTSPQIVTSQQQQQTVLGLLQGAAQQQAQAAYAVSGGSAQNTPLSHQQVRQMLSQRTQNTLTIPNAPSTTSSLQQVLSSRPPPLPVATQRSAQHPGQIMVQHPIHPSQANLPVRSVLAAQQQVLLQQQSRLPLQSLPGPSASTSSTAPRVVSASSAPVLAAVYDLDKPGIKSNKQQYRIFKKKFKYLVFENECYQEELRNLQRKLLKLSRDKNFLLDRLMQFEKLSDSSDDDSDSSQKTADERPKTKKRIRPSQRKRTADESLSDIGGKRFMDSSMGSTPSPSPSPAPSVTTVLAPSTSGHYTMSPVGSTPEASPVKTASVHHCPPGPSTTSAVVRSTNSSRSLLSSKEGVDSSVQRQSSQRPESHPSLATVDLRPSPLRVKVESLPLPPAKKNFAVMNPSTSSNRTLSSQPIPSPNNPGLSASSVSIRNSMLNGSAVEGPVTSLPIPLVSMSSASFSVATSTAPSPSEVVQHLVSMVPPQLGIRTSSTFTSAPSLPPSVSHLNGQMPMNTKKEGSEERPFVSVSQPR